MSLISPLPQNDGITHINIYSKGKTELGRFLSNFAYAPFQCVDGQFNCVEGYWYWLSVTHPRREELRSTNGWNSKKLGRELRGQDWVNTPDFQSKICAAITAKIEAYPRMKQQLQENTFPFEHYYVYGTKIYNEKNKALWMIKHIESFQKK
jgi:hypothetical protein